MMKSLRTIRTLIVFLMFVPSAASAQQGQPNLVKRGGAVFAETCTGYCHGADGAAGSSAPALAGRGLDADYILKVVSYGVEKTAMPAWGQRLPTNDLNAVVAYVESLNGLTESANVVPLRDLTPEAEHGRDLFFDADGELKKCSNCHQVNGKGLSVTPQIGTVPADATALRNLATPRVSTATVDGKAFPAVVVTKVRDEMKLYDLTTFPPVLLTLAPSAVKLSDTSSWQHSSVLGTYTDKDLESILAFLRAIPRP